ncbi:hypothetical protein THOM_1439 [Trachipleistophora hominis]|uniref:Uncharacterized protein n=1 Tax=Trachipleistophora hominis TaxID=72359 RepID=L7JWZ3_TRAHO|nr:hypothetical protein THOM_1439 [Trachipleistophora hominis]
MAVKKFDPTNYIDSSVSERYILAFFSLLGLAAFFRSYFYTYALIPLVCILTVGLERTEQWIVTGFACLYTCLVVKNLFYK